ncbi:lipoprotein NlpI [Rhodoblastus acidophilus]|nr:tetratricopeptide repeat protein [Rhodoblastus acidophilus]MCW2274596.1 lipoprotein NlpI [Rhodoblastus acidophilus]
MRRAVWFVAGALLATGAARAEDQAPVTDFGRTFGPRVIPTPAAPGSTANPAEKPTQSPQALACANSDGKASPTRRDEACSFVIDQRKWTGKEISWAYANRCAARYKLKQLDRALADCSEAIDQDPDQANAYQLRAEIHRKRDNRAKALEDYDKAIALGAKSSAVFAGRGLLHLLDGDGAKALEDFNQEVALAGGLEDSWMDRGSARLSLGDNAEAEHDFARATELAPKSAQAWLNRGIAALGMGEKAKAAEFFGEALKLDPAQAYAALWRFLASDGSPAAKSELQAWADKATSKDWPFVVTQLYLGRAETAEALGAPKDDDQQCEARFYVAENQLRQGAAQEAATGLKRAVESCPKNFIEYFRAVADLKTIETK